MASVNNGTAQLRSDITQMLIEGMAHEDRFIGPKVFPAYLSDTKHGVYLKMGLNLGELFNNDAKSRTLGSAYSRTNRTFEKAEFDCEEFGLEELIDDSLATDLARFGDIELSVARALLGQLMIAHESRCAALLNDPATFNATAALVAYTEANLSSINLPGDVAAAKNRLLKKGQTANAVIMSGDVYERVRRSTLLQNQVFGVVPKAAGQAMLPDEAAVAQALGVEKLLVSRAPKNAAKKGANFVGSYAWGNTYIAVADVQEGEFTNGGVGRTIVWTADSDLFTTETYRDEERRSTVIRVRQNVDEVVVNPHACELITTSYA